MTTTLITNARLLTSARDVPGMAGQRIGDILIRDGRISAIGPGLTAPEGAQRIDGTDHLVMPGLVNAHTHSSEMFFRGRYERMPLEVWLLYAYPFLSPAPVSDRLLYLRTMLVAMESLKSGVTMLSDDFFEVPGHDPERLKIVFQAYGDSGIRANVSSAVMNIPALDCLPFARKILPAEVQRQIDGGRLPGITEYIEFSQWVLRELHGGSNGRLRYMLAPSAPQRCTPPLMQALMELAQAHDVPYHTHVLETVTQAVTGPELHGRSLIRYMDDLGLLTPNTAIAHSVWVDEDDIALIGGRGCSVAHNAISNQKLGAGLAPAKRLLTAGANVALGTDGASSNDTLRIFDVMRVAALVHATTSPDPEDWLDAETVLHAATAGGARAAMLDHVTGTLEAGKVADLVMLDLNSLAFTPLNHPGRQLVYSENGSSVSLVMVDGQIVVEKGRLTKVDEAALLAEIREEVTAHLADHTRSEAANRTLEPWFRAIHKESVRQWPGVWHYTASKVRS